MKVSDVLNFIEALSIGNQENKQMSGNLVKVLKQSEFMKTKHMVPLYAISYLSDFELKTSGNFASALEESLINHLDKYSPKELSYLLVSLKSSPNFSDNESMIARVYDHIHQKDFKNVDFPT